METTKNEAYIASQDANNIHISYSEFSQYMQCPHLHLIMKFLKIDEQPPSIHLYFGNALHEAIEFSIKNNASKDQVIDFFRNRFRSDMINNMKDYEQFLETDDFLSQGEDLLKIINVQEIFSDYEITSVEESLYENIYKKFYFKGFIDLTGRKIKNKKKRLITDWKSSGEPWDVEKKKKDLVFLDQMRLYKYFWARKNNVLLDDVECKYVVLNRLKNKKDKNSGCGGIQVVDITSTKEEIFQTLKKLTTTIKNIHLENEFPKIKFIGNERMGCMFCKYKGGNHPLCNSNYNQYVELLKEHKK